MESLLVAFASAALAIYLILTVLFNSATQPLMVMTAIPMGVLGVIVAFVAATILVPETRTSEVRRREELRQRRGTATESTPAASVWTSLPRPLVAFGTLLLLDFISVFTFAFVLTCP